MDEKKPLPLMNTGNNCCFNSLLQCIVWNEVYAEALLTYLDSTCFKGWKECLTKYIQMAKAKNQKEIFPINSEVLRIELGMNSGTQEDAQEALMRLFSALPDGYPSHCYFHKTKNMIRDVNDQGNRAYKCKALNCTNIPFFRYDADVCISGLITRYTNSGHKLENTKFSQLLIRFPHNSSSKVMNHNFQDLIDKYIFKLLEPEEQYQILQDSKKTKSSSMTVVAEEITFIRPNDYLPSTLTLVFSRFKPVWRKNKIIYEKINDTVDIPFKYNFKQLFSNNKNIDDDNFVVMHNKHYEYELCSFIQHTSSGSTIKSGHYIAFVNTNSQTNLPWKDQTWFCCNDSTITRITDQDALINASKHAYICFFRALYF